MVQTIFFELKIPQLIVRHLHILYLKLQVYNFLKIYNQVNHLKNKTIIVEIARIMNFLSKFTISLNKLNHFVFL